MLEYQYMDSENHTKIRKELGENFRKARERLKLTQLEVAEESGMSVNYYAQIERGIVNPSFDKLQNVMKVLKLKSFNVIKP